MTPIPLALLPNSTEEIQKRVAAGKISWRRPAWMLASRLILFGVFQALLAAIFALTGSAQPWEDSIPWWLLTATLANLASLGLLTLLAHHEGMRLRDLYVMERSNFWQSILICLALLLVIAPLAVLPNLGLANLLFADPNQAATMMFRPLPLWAIITSGLLFPITVALSEIPTYYSYSMPRLAALTGKGWWMVILAGLFHAAQHMTLPLIFDGPFILWRLGMFLPFALVLAAILYKRPRLLPYLMVIHGLLDAQLAFMIPILK